MTKAELIEALKDMPEDVEIVVVAQTVAHKILKVILIERNAFTGKPVIVIKVNRPEFY